MGGSWGAHLKFSGYDAAVVHGKAEKPVYLLVRNGKAELRDASTLWGKDAAETSTILKGELGSSARVLAIGQAGENLVTFAFTLADEDASAWSVAIMGSKNLKAIVVQGEGGRPPVAHPEKVEELVMYLRILGYGSGYNLVKFLDAPSLVRKQSVCYGCIRGCGRSSFETSEGIKSKFDCQSAVFIFLPPTPSTGSGQTSPFMA